MANKLDMGEYALAKKIDVIELIERSGKVERIQSFSLVERSHLIRLIQYLERDRAKIMAQYPNSKHSSFPEVLEPVKKNVQPLEEKPAYILDIGNHNNDDFSGVIVDIGNHNDDDTSGVIVDIACLRK